MSYQKFTVDNLTCSRRMHLCYDDENAKLPQVKVTCPYCNATIFAAKNHPPVEIARQENLIRTSQLSDITTRECFFKDGFSVAPKNI